ncbi:MAG: peroxide stress protein YaaA [Hyphomicrobiales bacterium]|nr:peroxide stress protein YaaA [Hyphomicrobiales bacterium]
MLIVVSPAKKLNMDPIEGINSTKPDFSENAKELINLARSLSINEIMNLMSISSNLAQLNMERFSSFGDQEKKPAALAFAGDTYKGLEADSMTSDDLKWAQKHLCILSGLYGLLRPLDAIEPYRLEMGSKLEGKHGKSLYDYWGKKISEKLNEKAKENNSQVLVNCASNEYFNAVHTDSLSLKVITPIFMDRKNGKEKIISFYAKKARGSMARFIIQNRITELDILKSFNVGGYSFQSDQSDETKWFYTREHPVN